ncbi:MAG: acyl carrier protein [Myxococcota bacterium]
MSEARDDILTTVADLIREVIGEDWADEVAIGPETSFAEDLELESIEFVALAERLQEHYGEGVDFVGWISDKELDEIIALKVGDLVEFISTCRSS